MILDWFHRKFLERFMHIQSEITYDSNYCDNYGEDYNNRKDLYGHRYRYYIPQANPIENGIHRNILKDNLVKNTDQDSCKTSGTEMIPVQDPNQSKPKRLNRIKLFYVVPNNNKMAKPNEQSIKNDFIKQVFPPAGHFLVIPLPVQSLTSSETSEAAEVLPEKDSNNKSENEPNKSEKEHIVEDSKQPIAKTFAEENNRNFDEEDRSAQEEGFFEGPFMEFNMQKHEMKENGYNSNPTNLFAERRHSQSDDDAAIEDLCLDGGWCGDITFQIPSMNEYFRKKLKNSSENLNRSGVFNTFLRKFLFKPKLPQEFDEN